MKLPVYRLSRITVAAIIFSALFAATWFWKGYEGLFATQIGSSLLKLAAGQYALGAGMAVAVILILTFLFGRVYCSILCPLGILQDAMMIFRRKFTKQSPYRLIRYGVFGFVLASLLAGFILPLSLLMPSAAWLMIQNNICRKIWQEFATLFSLDIQNQAINPAASGFIAAWTVFLLLLILARWRGRVYCNTLCPVGALLGLISRASVFRIRLNEKCVSCGACERSCKSGCIDSKTKTVNQENCVLCLNCLDTCKFHAISYAKSTCAPMPFSPSRRGFLATGGAVAGGLVAGTAISKLNVRTSPIAPVMPPGAGTLERFQSKCVSCGLCIGVCKGHVLTHAGMQYGIAGILQPYLNFKRGACEFNCSNCMDVCPCGALAKIPLKEKQSLRIGLVHYNREVCIPYEYGTDCGACAEHCPVAALEMVPWKETKIPKVHEDLCIGCGACQNICPVTPVPAVVIHGVSPQFQVKKPRPAETKKLAAEEDFPF